MNYMKKLKLARKAKGYTQQQIAEALGIDQRQYSRYENGYNEMPVRYVAGACRFLGISADWLLEIGDSPCGVGLSERPRP